MKSSYKNFRVTVHTIVLIISTLLSCNSDPRQELEKKINIAIRSENSIDENEWNNLVKYIIDNKNEFPDLIEGDNVSTDNLKNFILEFSQQRSRKGQTSPEIFVPKALTENSVATQVKIFVENSGSMDGYVRGIKDFEIVVGKLLVLSKDYCIQTSKRGFEIFFVNKYVYPAPEIKELNDFAKALEPTQAPYNKGIRGESILNDVLKNIIDSTSNNSISILISDCIYSLEPTKDTKGSLGYQQNGTMEVFLNKFRQNPNVNFTTCIYKMESEYEGNYFPYDYNPKLKNSISLSGTQYKRPYYIWVIGEDKLVAEFTSKIRVFELKGFQHSYILSNSVKIKPPYYCVLKQTNKIGNFKATDRNKKDLQSISDVDFDNGSFQFSIAIDLSNIPVDSSYLTNTGNYIVPEGFTVRSIERINRNKLSQRDYVTVEKTRATHFITVSTTNKFSIQNLVLQLSNKIPSWVEQSTSMNDRNVKEELDRTFGLSYLIKGVSDAYETQNPEQKSYFKIIVTIKK